MSDNNGRIAQWTAHEIRDWAMTVVRAGEGLAGPEGDENMVTAGIIADGLRRGEQARLRVLEFENAIDLSRKSETEATIVIRAIKALVGSV